MKRIPLMVAGAVFAAQALVEGARVVLDRPWPGFTSASLFVSGPEAILWLAAAAVSFTGARRFSPVLPIAIAVSIGHAFILLVLGNHLACLGFLVAAAITATSMIQHFIQESSRVTPTVRYREPLPARSAAPGAPAFR